MKITVYSKPNCPACVAVKESLRKQGKSYTEVVVGKDITREAFLEKFPQVRSMPHIDYVDA